MNVQQEQELLARLDFPTPRPEYRPLHSGLLVPSNGDDTAPFTAVPATEPASARAAVQDPASAALEEPAPGPPPAPTPRHAAPAPTPVTGGQWLAGLLAEAIERRRARRREADHTVPGWTLIPLALLMLAAAAAAFVLSFQMILPVVEAAGWTTGAWLGPVVIDLAAIAAAFMAVASRHPAFVHTGRFLLVTATALSIALNLAGHQVTAAAVDARGRRILPPAWEWAVSLFSVTVPVILAVLIHVFGTALITWATQRRRHADEAAATPAPPPAAATSSPARPRPAASKVARAAPVNAKEEALRAARAAGATTPKTIRQALQRAGIRVPSQSTLENYARELRTAS